MKFTYKLLYLIIIGFGFALVNTVHATTEITTFETAQTHLPTSCNTTNNFRPEDALYHNYPELVADVQNVVNAYPSLVQRFSIGSSYEGCDLIAVKISKNVAMDETMLQTCYISATF